MTRMAGMFLAFFAVFCGCMYLIDFGFMHLQDLPLFP